MAFAAAALPYMQYAGMALQAYGSYQNSKATQSAYGAQAQVNRNNAQIAEWQAQDAITRGQQSASRIRMKSNQLKGTQRAGMAANGVDLGTGSALRILSDTDLFKEIDANQAIDNAAREAWAIRNQAQGYNTEASLLQARADRESPLMAGGTSLLTSAGKVASNWYTPGTSTPADASGYRYKVPTYEGAEY
jgi:hypothetical protein